MMLFLILLFVGMVNPVFAQSSDSSLQATAVSIPGGGGGIGFDDLVFSPELHKVLVPGGRMGKLYLIDPATFAMTSIGGFSFSAGYQKGHDTGITSADEGDGFIFAIDRSAMFVDVIDPLLKRIISSATLADRPDYVRYVKEINEVWVTQPGSERIEIFTFSTKIKPALSHAGFIDVPGGPESLIIDHTRQQAYTHTWEGKTLAIDIHERAIKGEWSNGCSGSRGIALDEKRGFLFAGCAEGKAVVFDLNRDNKKLSSLVTDPGTDVISYNPKLSHLYFTSSGNATLSVIGVSALGKLSLLGKAQADIKAHCVVSDDQNNIWVCDPPRGQLLRYKDTF